MKREINSQMRTYTHTNINENELDVFDHHIFFWPERAEKWKRRRGRGKTKLGSILTGLVVVFISLCSLTFYLLSLWIHALFIEFFALSCWEKKTTHHKHNLIDIAWMLSHVTFLKCFLAPYKFPPNAVCMRRMSRCMKISGIDILDYERTFNRRTSVILLWYHCHRRRRWWWPLKSNMHAMMACLHFVVTNLSKNCKQ